MAKRNQVSYAGIPVKERARIKILQSSLGLGKTPQEIWKNLNERWADQAADKQHKEAEAAKELEKHKRDRALESIEPALDKLANARDMAGAIENGKMDYMEDTVLARCARLMLEEAGAELENALRELTIIPKIEHGYFVTRRSTDFEAPEEKEIGVRHG